MGKRRYGRLPKTRQAPLLLIREFHDPSCDVRL
jgi:hypothetical protein